MAAVKMAAVGRRVAVPWLRAARWGSPEVAPSGLPIAAAWLAARTRRQAAPASFSRPKFCRGNGFGPRWVEAIGECACMWVCAWQCSQAVDKPRQADCAPRVETSESSAGKATISFRHLSARRGGTKLKLVWDFVNGDFGSFVSCKVSFVTMFRRRTTTSGSGFFLLLGTMIHVRVVSQRNKTIETKDNQFTLGARQLARQDTYVHM